MKSDWSMMNHRFFCQRIVKSRFVKGDDNRFLIWLSIWLKFWQFEKINCTQTSNSWNWYLMICQWQADEWRSSVSCSLGYYLERKTNGLMAQFYHHFSCLLLIYIFAIIQRRREKKHYFSWITKILCFLSILTSCICKKENDQANFKSFIYISSE